MPCAQGRTGSDRSTPGARLRCSGTSSRARGRKPISTDTSRPREKGVQSLFDRQLLPAFGSKPLDRIALAQIGRWFDRFSRTAPGNANHALDLLTQIIISPSPAATSKPTRVGRGKEPETDAHALSVPRGDRSAPSRPGQADPRQQARAGGHHPAPASDRMPQERDPSAALVGSRSRQAGPPPTARRAPGSFPSIPPARRILERRPRGGSPFVFPSPRDPARPRSRNLAFWDRARRGSRHRGRSPSRPPPLPRQPRGDERRAGSPSSLGCSVIPMCGRRCVTPIWEIARSRRRRRGWDNPSPRSYATRMCIRRCVGVCCSARGLRADRHDKLLK